MSFTFIYLLCSLVFCGILSWFLRKKSLQFIVLTNLAVLAILLSILALIMGNLLRTM